MSISVVIADDHEIVRRGLRMTIAGEEDMVLLGEASNGREAVDLVARTQPDVALLDIHMPEMSGIDAARMIRERFPSVQVLIVTGFGNDAHLYAALQAGVTGYLLKDATGDELVDAIRGAAQGKPQLHPQIARRLMTQMPRPKTPLDELSEREREVLTLIGRGMSNKEIANALHLTEATIKGYVSAILGKLHVDDRTQAALLAVRYGLIELEELPGGALF
ncbi:MAG: response regulator transcription factor [Chloroflexi bacterium]|nr:response regulator transcription factor [Chloroflexota bacterium]